jgi:transposase
MLQEARDEFQQEMREKKEEGATVYYLDETGSNIGDIPAYGRSSRGLKVHCAKKKEKGERISTIAILNPLGVQQAFCYEGTLNGELFAYYTQEFLIPFLQVGDILVLDNATAHYNTEAWDMLIDHGIDVRFQPPYSPDMNPIEMAWSKIKGFIKKQYTKTKEELYMAIEEAIKIITPENSEAYINKCLYRDLLKP